MNDSHQDFLSRHKLLTFLAPDQIQTFKKAASLKSYEDGDIVIEEGKKAQFLFIVYDGSLSVFAEDFDGDKELAILKPGDFMGEISVISNQPTSASIRCLSKAVLIAIPKDTIILLKEKNPSFAQFLSKTSIDRFEENLSKQM